MQLNEITERSKAVGKSIKEYRIKRGYNQRQLADSFSVYVKREKPYNRTTISTWEKGCLPREQILTELAEFLNAPYGAFSYWENEQKSVHIADNGLKNEEEFARYDHEPVFVEFGRGNAKWGIIDARKGVIIFSHDRMLPFSDLEGYDILRRPLPFSTPADATFENSTPMSLREIRLSEKVWVEPVGGTWQYRQDVKDWGQFDSISKTIRLRSGVVFSLDRYGKEFLCFAEPCVYSSDEKSYSLYSPESARKEKIVSLDNVLS